MFVCACICVCVLDIGRRFGTLNFLMEMFPTTEDEQMAELSVRILKHRRTDALKHTHTQESSLNALKGICAAHISMNILIYQLEHCKKKIQKTFGNKGFFSEHI